MKKTVALFLMISLTAASAYSQGSGIFLKGGLNVANVSTTTDGHIDDANSLMSYHVGITADLHVGTFVAIQPSLLFTGKGSKTQAGTSGSLNYYKATSNPRYLELPINIVGKIPLSDKKSNFFIGAGPYIAVGIGGKNKTEGNFNGLSYSGSDKIEFSNDAPETLNEQEGAGLGILRRFDYGLNGTAGFELNGFLMALNYGYGLAKINSVGENDNDKNKHRVLSFSIGFKL